MTDTTDARAPADAAPPPAGGRGAGGRAAPWPMTDGEIHFLWWFIQGSLMISETRRRIRRAWGFCPRHAWGALAVEMAFRNRFLLGPAILYQDLMTRALGAIPTAGPWPARRLARRLAPKGPCLLCALDVRAMAADAAPPERLERGRRTEPLSAFARALRPHWTATVCGLCRGDGGAVRCRRHLVEDASAGRLRAPGAHRALAADVLARLSVYERAFVWGARKAAGPEHRAALISAVGWMSGWRPLLVLLGERPEGEVEG